ncbi:hypothetical protein YPPY66_0332, partial [Yersinia pestis PY-66]
MKHLVLDNLRF